MVLCKQVQEGITALENQRYIRRNLEFICDSLLDILHSGPGQEAKQQVAKCLGRIGYVVDQDFKRYVNRSTSLYKWYTLLLCIFTHIYTHTHTTPWPTKIKRTCLQFQLYGLDLQQILFGTQRWREMPTNEVTYRNTQDGFGDVEIERSFRSKWHLIFLELHQSLPD